MKFEVLNVLYLGDTAQSLRSSFYSPVNQWTGWEERHREAVRIQPVPSSSKGWRVDTLQPATVQDWHGGHQVALPGRAHRAKNSWPEALARHL